MKEIKLWEIGQKDGDKSVVLPLKNVDQTKTENQLEEILVKYPDLLGDGLKLVGRQTNTAGGPLDLLGVDDDGRLVVFELKRGTLTRNAVSQIIDYSSYLDDLDPKVLASHIAERSGTLGNLLSFLDENRYQPRKQLISHHEDELTSHTRGYGKGEKPEDYLNEFKSFILGNMNKIPALAIICQRPRELTRQDLRKLKLALDEDGYSEPKLRTAWRESTNEDIAADIISFIRRQALGDPLVSHEERIRVAMKKVYNLKPWPKMQKMWLERIEKQLIAETIIDRDDFDHGAFKAHGGFSRINKIFQGNLSDILEEINNALYPEEKKYA